MPDADNLDEVAVEDATDVVFGIIGWNPNPSAPRHEVSRLITTRAITAYLESTGLVDRMQGVIVQQDAKMRGLAQEVERLRSVLREIAERNHQWGFNSASVAVAALAPSVEGGER